MKPELEELVMKLNENEREFFEERAAIMEYNGQMSRDQAEKLAYFETLDFFGK